MGTLFIMKGTQEAFEKLFGTDEEIRRKQRMLNAESCNYRGDWRSQAETNEAELAGE